MPFVMKRDDLLITTMRMIEHCAQCARRATGGDGAWVLLLNEPRHDYKADSAPLDLQQLSIGGEFLTELAAAAKAARPQITEVEVEEDDDGFDADDPSTFNQRPIDPEWIERVDQLAEEAAQQLQAFVVMVASQDMGKMAMSTGGEDLPGKEIAQIKEIAADMPAFLRLLAEVTERSQRHSKSTN